MNVDGTRLLRLYNNYIIHSSDYSRTQNTVSFPLDESGKFGINCFRHSPYKSEDVGEMEREKGVVFRFSSNNSSHLKKD